MPEGKGKQKIKDFVSKVKNVFKSKKRKSGEENEAANLHWKSKKLEQHKREQRGEYKSGGRIKRDQFTQQYD
jgi:hypothetical protein